MIQSPGMTGESYCLLVSVCSQEELTDNLELIQTYRLHIAQDINQDNLALFCASYSR